MLLAATSYKRTEQSQEETSRNWFELGPNLRADITSSGTFLILNSVLESYDDGFEVTAIVNQI